MVHETLSQADYVINTKLGGINAAARILGHRNSSTVQGWVERGYIPPRRQAEVLKKAREAGIEFSPSDFVVHLGLPDAVDVSAS